MDKLGHVEELQKERNVYRTSVGILKEREHFENLSLDRMILKLLLRNRV
jgi:hypothetical protein